jgi:hypothetical protein
MFNLNDNRMRKKITSLFLLLGFSLSSLWAAEIYVEKLSGEVYDEAFATIGNVYRQNGKNVMVDRSGNVLWEVRSISFKLPSSVTSQQDQEALKEGSVVVYPNPVTETLQLKGVGQEETIRLYDQQGRLLKMAQGDRLEMGDVEPGIYLLQVRREIVKIIKK